MPLPLPMHTPVHDDVLVQMRTVDARAAWKGNGRVYGWHVIFMIVSFLRDLKRLRLAAERSVCVRPPSQIPLAVASVLLIARLRLAGRPGLWPLLRPRQASETTRGANWICNSRRSLLRPLKPANLVVIWTPKQPKVSLLASRMALLCISPTHTSHPIP